MSGVRDSIGKVFIGSTIAGGCIGLHHGFNQAMRGHTVTINDIKITEPLGVVGFYVTAGITTGLSAPYTPLYFAYKYAFDYKKDQ